MLRRDGLSNVGSLNLGDDIECMFPNRTIGYCTVYYVSDALHPPAMYGFVKIGYAGGHAMASADHEILVNSFESKPMRLVAVGDIINAVIDGELTFSTVLDVSETKMEGAYNFFLTDAGLPVVDGVVFYPYATPVLSQAGMAGNILVHYINAPIWQHQITKTPFKDIPEGVDPYETVLESAFASMDSLPDFEKLTESIRSLVDSGEIFTEQSMVALLSHGSRRMLIPSACTCTLGFTGPTCEDPPILCPGRRHLVITTLVF